MSQTRSTWGIREEIFLPAAGASVPRLFQRLQEAGVDKELVLRRILPLNVLAEIELPNDDGHGRDADIAIRAASTIGTVFGFTPGDVFGAGPLVLQREAAATARLKVPATANEPRLVAYAIYANYLARLVLQATAESELRPIPSTAAECREATCRPTVNSVRHCLALRMGLWASCLASL